ncbi:MAG TPA: YdgA family protein [Rhodocyclaceae bacterium]|nr:YdgA family protein [Rhodocyclaceae bacterium]HMV52561.1 YdgA family protein [Rhodocyclaceae bacterium]HNA03432.1 YdgA family protein [Rhodocyclaceae bacterium]HNB79132.1 YdgA family protein [Rhodocyclaceae bacterium]HNC60723.1 YdgA family protein [Rhodocyclaceae bacterium]
MKTSRAVALVAAPIGAYLLASWIVGAKVQSALDEQYKILEGLPYIKVADRKYERGLFSATETVTFEVMGDMFRALQKAQKEAAAADPEAAAADTVVLEPLRFTVRSSFKHGPLPGFSTLAAATSDSELVLDDKTMQELKPVLGDNKPLTAHTVYRFDGGGVSNISSPAFSMNMPGDSPENVGKLAWQGFTATMEFDKGLANYRMTGDAPRMQMTDRNGSFVMSGLKFEADQKRIFDDEPMLYSGTQRMTVAQFDIAAVKEGEKQSPVAFKQLVVDVAMPVNGEFVDVIEKIGAASLQIGDKRYGPGNFDFSIRHLHARTVARFYREMMKLYSDPAVFTAAGDPARALAPLAEPGKELLKHNHNPEFRIDRFRFKSDMGEAAVSASVKLQDAKPEEFSNPLMLLGKLEAAADIQLPEALLGTLAASRMPGGTEAADDPETAAMQAQMLEQQLAGLAGQGLVTREGGQVKSKIEFRGGQLTVNGKPFNPFGMGGAMPPGAGAEGQAPPMAPMPR